MPNAARDESPMTMAKSLVNGGAEPAPAPTSGQRPVRTATCNTKTTTFDGIVSACHSSGARFGADKELAGILFARGL